MIGKFYPPHAGHHLLVDEAAAACDRVTVVVAAHPAETIPLEARTGWMAATHAHQPHVRIVGDVDPHPVDYDDPVVWAAHVGVFAAAVTRAVVADGLAPHAAQIDAVFSSEAYGDELARRFGATHVSVDAARTRRPVSGTKVRGDVPGHWDVLSPATRAGLALRVVILGAESSGTTTLATDLAGTLANRGGPWAATRWVPEYGRDHTLAKVAALDAQGVLDRPASGWDLC